MLFSDIKKSEETFLVVIFPKYVEKICKWEKGGKRQENRKPEQFKKGKGYKGRGKEKGKRVIHKDRER